jgi:hypothetical protein
MHVSVLHESGDGSRKVEHRSVRVGRQEELEEAVQGSRYTCWLLQSLCCSDIRLALQGH